MTKLYDNIGLLAAAHRAITLTLCAALCHAYPQLGIDLSFVTERRKWYLDDVAAGQCTPLGDDASLKDGWLTRWSRRGETWTQKQASFRKHTSAENKQTQPKIDDAFLAGLDVGLSAPEATFAHQRALQKKKAAGKAHTVADDAGLWMTGDIVWEIIPGCELMKAANVRSTQTARPPPNWVVAPWHRFGAPITGYHRARRARRVSAATCAALPTDNRNLPHTVRRHCAGCGHAPARFLQRHHVQHLLVCALPRNDRSQDAARQARLPRILGSTASLFS